MALTVRGVAVEDWSCAVQWTSWSWLCWCLCGSFLDQLGSQRAEEKSQECLDLVASAWPEGDRVAEVFSLESAVVPGSALLLMSTWTWLQLGLSRLLGLKVAGMGLGAAEGEGRGTFGSVRANWGLSRFSHSWRRQ